MDRRSALDALGLDATSDLDAVKRRFRTLARDLHPDHGGDPRAFHDLQVAYRLLCRDLEGRATTPRPRVARGRPSRERPGPAPAPTTAGRSLAPLTDADLRALLSDRRHRLDEEQLARLLLVGTRAGRGHQLVSRTPANRSGIPGALSALRDAGAISSLVLGAGTASARVELTARGRRARRALTELDMSALVRATWTRHRGDAVTIAAAELGRTERSEDGARHVAGAAVELLDALRWPLECWRIDSGAR